MSTIDILSEIKKLSVSEQRILVEKAVRMIRLEEKQSQMRLAANRLRADYETDPELTAFTALDSEPVHESM